MKDITLKEFIKMKLKKKEKKVLLTTDEMLKYQQLKYHNMTFSSNTLIFPFICSFWFGLFVIVMKYAYGVDLKLAGLLITGVLFKMGLVLIFMMGVVMFFNSLSNSNMNKRLRDKIISERKK
jgi:hypothetical protein